MNTDLKERFLTVKKAALERRFANINPMQRQAVFQIKGPVLILAGAGSGKTTVIVNRILNMILFGSGYESTYPPPDIGEAELTYLADYAAGKTQDDGPLSALCGFDRIKPWRILAITFTNKAASELKERLARALGEEVARDIQASTFHSACVRILRREGERLGYPSGFTIYDSDDSLRVIKDVSKNLRIDDKSFPPRSLLTAISQAKDQLLSPAGLLAQAGGNYRLETAAKVYEGYQKQLKMANAMDFDDIIALTVRLFQENPEVLEYYQNRFQYIMVDEYQDTNHAQYMLVSLLSERDQNICVVGDDDQSIYRFRGADIANIMSFEEQFPGATVIRLEQNYRCTKIILGAANNVIAQNQSRKGKTLWTENEEGAKVKVYRANDEGEEARFIADTILENAKAGDKFADHAILYRMNAQSNTIEKALVRSGIPYRVISGVKFYERKEVKDVLAYLSVLENPADLVRLRRVVNEPKRGIGDATIATCQEIAESLGTSLFEVMSTAEEYAPLSKKAKPVLEFARMIEELMAAVPTTTLGDLFDLVLEKSGYKMSLIAQGPEGQTRMENVEELKTNILSYEKENETPTLSGFLEEVALYTDMDSYDLESDNVVLMTIHSAKGLEYKNIFLAGMEEGLFPGIQSMYSPVELEEERRLAYVGITRAKQRLFLTNAAQRMLFGRTSRNRPSRFVGDIPTDFVESEDQTVRQFQNRGVSAAFEAKKKATGGGALGISAGPTPSGVTYGVGERVRHRVFGEGEIIHITPMGNDSLLEVRFDTVGSKKIMQNFAKLQKL